MNVTKGKPLPTSQFLARGWFEVFWIDNYMDSLNGLIMTACSFIALHYWIVVEVYKAAELIQIPHKIPQIPQLNLHLFKIFVLLWFSSLANTLRSNYYYHRCQTELFFQDRLLISLFNYQHMRSVLCFYSVPCPDFAFLKKYWWCTSFYQLNVLHRHQFDVSSS